MSTPADQIRVRLRTESLDIDKELIVDRVTTFFDKDGQARDVDREDRLQRHAKYRMWNEGTDDPWPDASDVPLSDMTEKSLRVQDTLNNAVMAQRPAVNANAVTEANAGKEETIDALLDYQFFVEQPGEMTIGDLADAFVNDGEFVAFIPWIEEFRRESRVILYDPIPENLAPAEYFRAILEGEFRDATVLEDARGEAPWDYRVRAVNAVGEQSEQTDVTVKFFTRESGRVEAVIKGTILAYNGPRVIVKDFDDVFHPPRAANLQPPSPSNPNGAAHVILRDHPTIDEIVRLHKDGFYDLLTDEDVKGLKNFQRGGGTDQDAEEAQRDDLSGLDDSQKTIKGAESQKTLTRLLCFDRFDLDGDGLDEDVMWWVLLEPKLLAKAKVTQEMYPLRPNRSRPLAEASLFPLRGRRKGFSLLELMEGAHDVMKMSIDQTMNANALGVMPFGFYRPSSSMNNEIMRLRPGDFFPLSDPRGDVNIPQIGNPQAQGMALNIFTLMQQLSERATVVGDMQLGRVPAGRSSALRTVGGMSLLAGQGEARPERMLRRFFNGVAQIYSIMHDLNGFFLPKDKQIRVVGKTAVAGDPYQTITDRREVRGEFVFDFQANVFNTAKQQLQIAYESMLQVYVNGLAIQMGVSTPETIYNLYREYGRSLGVDPESKRFINPPSPGLTGPKILAEEAIVMILQDQLPDGAPLELGGWIEHLQKLIALEEQFTDERTDTGELTPNQAQLLQQWKVTVQGRAQEQQRQEQLQANANTFNQSLGGGGDPGGRPAEQAPADPNANPQVSGGGELLDETLPTAGGGA